MDTYGTLNEVLVRLFRDIMDIGTLTIAMNSLVKKGYVTRQRGKEDRRVVYISLSEKGKQAFEHHAKFHQEMIRGIVDSLGEDEIEVLIKALTNLNHWFRSL